MDGLDWREEVSWDSVAARASSKRAFVEVGIDHSDIQLLGTVVVDQIVAVAGCTTVVLAVYCVYFVSNISEAEMLKDPERKIMFVAFSYVRKSSTSCNSKKKLIATAHKCCLSDVCNRPRYSLTEFIIAFTFNFCSDR